MYLSVLMLLKTKNPKKKRTLLPARRHFLPFTKRISPKIRKYENLLTLPPFVCDLSFVEIRSIRSDYIHDTLYTTHQKPKTKPHAHVSIALYPENKQISASYLILV